MESNLPKTGTFALKFGVILALIGIVFHLMLHFSDLQYAQSWANSVVSISLMLAVIIIAIYQFKKANSGFLTLSEALKVGIGTALIAGLISAIYTFIYANVIEPDFALKSAELNMAYLTENNPNLSAADLQKAKENQINYFWIAYPMVILFNLFLGFVISLLVGLVMKKSKSDY